MLTNAIKISITLFLSVILFGCGDNAPRMDVEVNVAVAGKLIPNARIMMDGKLLGETGVDGQFNISMKQLPGKQLKLEVEADMAGYEVQPWKSEFTVKLPNEGEILKYVFDANLQVLPFVELLVMEKGAPVPGATVKIDNREVGKTAENGSLIYKYDEAGKKTAMMDVGKIGYSTWKKNIKLEPGVKVDANIFKQVDVIFEATKEEYGSETGIAGVAIAIDGKTVAKTNAMGTATINYAGVPGASSKVSYSAPSYFPSVWSGNVAIEGGATVKHTFNSLAAKPIRLALLRFGGNTPGVDLKDVSAQIQAAIRAQLFKNGAFNEVSTDKLALEIKKSNLSLTSLNSKGWQKTSLQTVLDMVLSGSVSKDEKGFIVELKFHSASGKLVHSEIIRADGISDINSAAKEITTNVMDRFPFEGTVVAIKEDRYEINLGKPYAINRGTEFSVITPATSGKTEQSPILMVVKKVGDGNSFAAIEDAAAVKVAIGDRVVRRGMRENQAVGKSSGRESLVLAVKGGTGKDAVALAGVNIYLNNDWIGTTGSDGHAKVALLTGKNYNLMLYRHGYQQVTEKLKIEKAGETKQFSMAANYALFKVESTPSSAKVYIDGELLGKTPMLEGKQIPLGFHTVRLSVGENYRDWEEVVEFDKRIEDRAGAKKIVLYKDYVKIGEAAEAKGNVDAAIAAYASTTKTHPDYSEAHHRLAQLYLDEKDNFDGAIREFENVLALPENEQLIFKQYAIAYTNLGHAYYEQGNNKMSENRNDAAQYYAKAVQNLKVSKQNMRFFPAESYDQAVHDTYFYMALSYQKLYMITKRSNMLSDANLAWRDYFDFFPRALEGDPVFTGHRETAKKFWNQIKEK